jgi:hypothetical protein
LWSLLLLRAKKRRGEIMPKKQKAKARKSTPEDARTTLLDMCKKLMPEPSEGLNSRALIAGAESGDELDLVSISRTELLSSNNRMKKLCINEALKKSKKEIMGFARNVGSKLARADLKLCLLPIIALTAKAKSKKKWIAKGIPKKTSQTNHCQAPLVRKKKSENGCF